jgi:hypothetical protein
VTQKPFTCCVSGYSLQSAIFFQKHLFHFSNNTVTVMERRLVAGIGRPGVAAPAPPELECNHVERSGATHVITWHHTESYKGVPAPAVYL